MPPSGRAGLIEPAYAARLRQHLSGGTCVAARLGDASVAADARAMVPDLRRPPRRICNRYVGNAFTIAAEPAASRLGCGSAATLGRYRQRPRATGYIRWAFRRQTDAILAKSASNTRNWTGVDIVLSRPADDPFKPDVGGAETLATSAPASRRTLLRLGLGSAALAGSAAPIARQVVAQTTGRSRPGWPSITWHSTIPSWRPTARASWR